MASALQHYHQLADYMATQITASFQSWTDFLTTAARLYKYQYHEQLMIYAQRPGATACAEYGLWNKRMGRYIRQGAKGIALIDHSRDTPRLRYVFDVADTCGTERSRSPYLWEYRPEHEQVVSHALEQQYSIQYTGDLTDQLEQISSVKVTEYFLAHQQDILDIVDGSHLEGYHDYDKGVAFLNAAAVSTTYMLLSRCGLTENAHFGPEDFMPVFDFNTPQTVNALGSAISGISEEILRNIEVTIKKYEREKLSERSQNHERTDLHPQRGLLDSQPEPVPAGGQASGQIREDAEEVSAGVSPGAVESPDPVGAAVSPSVGDRRGGKQPAGTDDAGADAVGGRDGSAESQRPDEVGGADEQPESSSRGSDPDGTDLRLTEDSPVEQFSFFPTEAQQIESIAEAERVQTAHSAFSMFISQDDKAQEAAQNPLYTSCNDIKAAHPDEIVLFQVGDFFELYGEDAKQAAELLGMYLTTRNIPGAGRVEMCGLPAHNLEMYVEKLRDKYDVTVAEEPDFRGEHRIYTLRSVGHEAEQLPQPTVQEQLERYRPIVIAAVSEDTAYRNACGHSDRENAGIECNAAVRRAILNSKDMELIRLFSDMPEFRSRLHQEVFEGTYARLHDLMRPLSQDDIDDALRTWNGNISSKHAVVQYMQQHGRERETAAWLAHEYGGNENNNLFIVRAGSPEATELT